SSDALTGRHSRRGPRAPGRPIGRDAAARRGAPAEAAQPRWLESAGPSSARENPMPAPSSLTVSSLHAGYPGLDVLQGIDLSISAGDPPLGLLGPSGSGKTTLLATLSGEHRPSAGQVS